MQNKHFNIVIKMAGKRIKALFMSTVLLIGTFSMLLLTGAVHQIQGMMMTG